MFASLPILSALLGGLLLESPATPRAVDPAAVAKLPAPGTVVPGAIAYSFDGQSIRYLKSEDASLSRVLWSVPIAGGEATVIARPPDSGDTDTNVSREEALRRERQRLRDTGITSVARAGKADVAVMPLRGDLYLQRGNGPLERLTDTPAPEIDPQLNADGTRVAYVREGVLYALEIASKKETKLSPNAAEGLTYGLAEFMAQEEMDRFTGFWWAPDGRHIAYQQTDERHIPLYTISHQGADPATETHRYPFPGKANAKVKLGVVAIEGGETTWLELVSPGTDFYLARVAWDSPSSLLLQILSRDQKSLRLERVDLGSKSRTLVREEKAETWVNLNNDLQWLGDTGEILWATERTGYKHLELLDSEGRTKRVLTEGDWAVDSVVSVDAKRREAWFLAGKDSPLESQLYRVSLDGGPVVAVSKESGIHKAVVAPSGGTWVDTFASREKPPVTRLRDRDGKVLRVLDDASSDRRIKQYRLVAPEFHTFKGRDGVILYGAYYAQRRSLAGGKSPLVVLLYGGPHVQYVSENWTMTADMNAQMLAERGFAVWKMDNRGASRRGHAFEAALNRNMGAVEVRDQADGVKYIAGKKAEIDASRVGVTGGSYGGYMTLRCLTEAPETFHAGVSIAPVTDWAGYDTCYTERYMGTPENNSKGYAESSVLNGVDRLRGKLFLIHGMIDENVHFRHTARLVTALIAANKTFKLLPLPEERHSSRQETDRRYVAEQALDFFRESLRLEP